MRRLGQQALAFVLVLFAFVARGQGEHLSGEGKNRDAGTVCRNETQRLHCRFLGQTAINQVPAPRQSIDRLLQAAQVKLPPVLPCGRTKVCTKKKLS